MWKRAKPTQVGGKDGAPANDSGPSGAALSISLALLVGVSVASLVVLNSGWSLAASAPIGLALGVLAAMLFMAVRFVLSRF